MKLKPIPNNTLVHTPTEAEAKELLSILHKNGYEWRAYSSPMYDTKWHGYYSRTAYFIHSDDRTISVGYKSDLSTITLAEFKERFLIEEEKLQPKFKVGDSVAIRWINKWGRITDVHFSEEAEEWEYNIKVNPKGLATALESNIKPYIEPEAKPTEENPFKVGDEVIFAYDCSDNDIHIVEEIEGMNIIIDSGRVYPYEMFVLFKRKIQQPTEDMGTKNETKDDTKGDTMETKDNTKELNLCELLADHIGERFYSPCYGDATIDEVNNGKITITADTNCKRHSLKADGTHVNGSILSYGMLFPSYALYEQYPLEAKKAWEVWQEEQMYEINISTRQKKDCHSNIVSRASFDTEADRDKAIGEIKAIIEKYSKI